MIILVGPDSLRIDVCDAIARGAAVAHVDGRRPNTLNSSGCVDAVKILRTNKASRHFFAGNEPWNHIVISVAQTPSGPVRKLSLKDAGRAMDSKFWGAYRIARALRITARGTLTFVSGFFSERPSASSVLQGAINAALEALARGLALELSPIRVNAILPGLIDTPL